MFHYLHLHLRISRKTYGKYRKSTEGKDILCTNREIMHLCQVNKIGQYLLQIIGGTLRVKSVCNKEPKLIKFVISLLN